VESAFCFLKHNPLIFADMQATKLFLKSKPGKIVQQNMGELMRHEVLAPRFFSPAGSMFGQPLLNQNQNHFALSVIA
jgi:hypothetical protein